MIGGGGLVTKFREFVIRENLITPFDQLLLAVSGGIDSTTLAYLLKEEGYLFSIVHCNFQLRGEESTQDEAFVRELSQKLNVRFFSTRFHVAQAKESGESTQMVARRLRYTYFRKILDEYNLSALVTAHHLEDSFETLLLNLIRGTGLSGIKGIEARTDFVAVRPFLEASRSDIRDYALSRNISWREDASNDSDDYARNRIRHHLAPHFFRTFEMSKESLAGSLSNLRSAERFYRRGLGLGCNPALVKTGEGFTLDRKACQLGYSDVVTLLRYHVGYMGFTAEEYRQMLSATGFREVGSGSYLARVSPEVIEFIHKPSVTDAEYRLEYLPFVLQLPGRTIRFELVDPPGSLDQPNTLYCRFPGFPLHLRSRQPGDRFSPLGMKGSKKVKDFLIDRKVAPWHRELCRLLTDQEGQVMAVVPYRTDERYAVRDVISPVLRISW